MAKQREHKVRRSFVIEKVPFIWCTTCNCTRREGELSECLRQGHELIERKLAIGKLM